MFRGEPWSADPAAASRSSSTCGPGEAVAAAIAIAFFDAVFRRFRGGGAVLEDATESPSWDESAPSWAVGGGDAVSEAPFEARA